MKPVFSAFFPSGLPVHCVYSFCTPFLLRYTSAQNLIFVISSFVYFKISTRRHKDTARCLLRVFVSLCV